MPKSICHVLWHYDSTDMFFSTANMIYWYNQHSGADSGKIHLQARTDFLDIKLLITAITIALYVYFVTR